MAGLLVLDNSQIEIVVTRGMTTPPALRSAVVLCVRQLYDGYREIRPTEAFYALIDPWRDHGSLTLVGFEPTGIAVPEVPIDPVISDHTRYFGWSDDRVIETVDFGAAASSMSNTGILPTRATNGYLWFGVPESAGYPSSLHIDNGSIDQLPVFVRQAGTVDDTAGNPHIVGVSFDIQTLLLAGQEIELGY